MSYATSTYVINHKLENCSVLGFLELQRLFWRLGRSTMIDLKLNVHREFVSL